MSKHRCDDACVSPSCPARTPTESLAGQELADKYGFKPHERPALAPSVGGPLNERPPITLASVDEVLTLTDGTRMPDPLPRTPFDAALSQVREAFEQVRNGTAVVRKVPVRESGRVYWVEVGKEPQEVASPDTSIRDDFRVATAKESDGAASCDSATSQERPALGNNLADSRGSAGHSCDVPGLAEIRTRIALGYDAWTHVTIVNADARTLLRMVDAQGADIFAMQAYLAALTKDHQALRASRRRAAAAWKALAKNLRARLAVAAEENANWKEAVMGHDGWMAMCVDERQRRHSAELREELHRKHAENTERLWRETQLELEAMTVVAEERRERAKKAEALTASSVALANARIRELEQECVVYRAQLEGRLR